MEGPVKDPEGNRVQIRYQRKTKQQYLMTDVDGKATGWRADFESGQWVITDKVAPKKASSKKKSAAKKKVAAKKKATAKKKAPAKKKAAAKKKVVTEKK